MDIKEENGIYSVTQKVIYEIVRKEDEALINALKDYAIKNSSELRLLDEDRVKEIIRKGLMVYHAEEHKVYSHSYIRKRDIEEEIEKLKKEIEELKEVKWYYEISRVPKDKIKAEIEELKLIADNGANAVRFAMTHDDEVERIQKQKDISAMIDFLQSLLEKE